MRFGIDLVLFDDRLVPQKRLHTLSPNGRQLWVFINPILAWGPRFPSSLLYWPNVFKSSDLEGNLGGNPLDEHHVRNLNFLNPTP